MTPCRTCGSPDHTDMKCPNAYLVPQPTAPFLWWVFLAELLSLAVGLLLIFAIMFLCSGCVVVNYPQPMTSTNRVAQRLSPPMPQMALRTSSTNATLFMCINVSLHQVPVMGSNNWESARQYVVTLSSLTTNTYGATPDGVVKLVTSRDVFVQGKIYSLVDGL